MSDIIKRFDSAQGGLKLWQELRGEGCYNKIASQSIILNYYLTNGLFKKIVDIVAIDALRKGITISQDSDKKFENYLSQISFKKHFTNAYKQAMLFSCALMVLDIDDGQYKVENGIKKIDMSQPVNFDNIKSVKIVYTFPLSKFTPAVSESYPLSWDYYNISPLNAEMQSLNVHKSRTILFTNDPLFMDAVNLFNPKFTDSIFYSTFEDIARLCDLLEMIVKLVEVSQYDIIKFDLDERLKSGKASIKELQEQIKNKVKAMNTNKSVYNTIAIDKMDDLLRIQSNLTGYDAIVQEIRKQVCAVSNIPATLLFGDKSVGMSNNGDKDLESYYNYISSRQEIILLEPIQQFLNLCSRVIGAKDKTPSFSFNPLWQLSESEIIKNRNMQAQTDKIYDEMGVLADKEIRRSRFGGLGYSIETNIDKSFDYSLSNEQGTSQQESNTTNQDHECNHECNHTKHDAIEDQAWFKKAWSKIR